jgi:hypothetical protein
MVRAPYGETEGTAGSTRAPDKSDTDKDGGLLSKFGVDPQALLGGLGGGGIGKALGG